MIHKCILILLILSILIGCSSIIWKQNDRIPNQRDITLETEDLRFSNGTMKQVWVGTYEGVLPNSSHEDKWTVVELKKNNTFIWKSESAINSKVQEYHSGILIIDVKGRILTIEIKKERKVFQFNEKSLLFLEGDRESTANGATKRYILLKR